MKRTIALFAFVALIFAASTEAKAQKLAHLNVDELLSLMPESQAAQKEIEAYATALQKDMEEMQTEAQGRYENLMANQANWTQLRITKEQEDLEMLAQRIQEYQVKAQQDLQNKQMELMKPIIEKAQNAVNDVAKDKGFEYVLDSSQSKGVVIFAEGGEDILPYVKAKLGITAPATPKAGQ